MNPLGLAFVYELELSIREARELRLRKRIDTLSDRCAKLELERELAIKYLRRSEAQLKEEQGQTQYLNRRIDRLLNERDDWKRRAQERVKRSHEEALAAQRRYRARGTT